MAMAAVTAGLLGTGLDVIDLGIVATPTVEVAVRELEAVGGIQISASHNPAEWNALKLLSSRGIFLTAEEGAELHARIESGRPVFLPADRLGKRSSRDDFSAVHVARIVASQLVDAEAIRKRRLHAVVDCVCGAGGRIASLLLDRLGVRASWLNEEPTGRFPHNPEPTPENLGELSRAVRDLSADVGFALDPDADRLAVVDEKGRPIGEETTLALVIDSVLPRVGGDVVVNVSTTMAIEEIAARHGARVHRTPVGEVNVTEKMLSIGARIGGEGNGGIIVPEVNPGRDGLLGMALALTALARSGARTSELSARVPSTTIRKEKIEMGAISVDSLWMEAIREGLESGMSPCRVDETDGLKLLWEDGWVHLRKSNTEPILRLLAEAKDRKRVDELIRVTRELVEKVLAPKV
jgi:phosphomannomutase